MPEFFFKFMNAAHRTILKLSGGRVLGKVGVMPVITLTTTGRKTGQARETALTSPIAENGSYVIVASKGGADHHPAWYLNLVANPSVTVTTAGQTYKMTARVASAEEKAELWPRIVKSYKGYAGYQTKTDRDIPVIICEPA